MFLQVNNLSKKFISGLECLKDINLKINKNDFISIVGPSGCGKSTLLKIISNLTRASNGDVVFGDNNKNISFVFQEPSLLPWASVFDNIKLPLKLKNNKNEDNKVNHYLQMVGLQDFKNSFPRELSGGMKMRVSLARALITEPELILFDEPFSALDEFTREQLNDEILSLKTIHQWTSIFVTHNIREAVYLSNRVILLSKRPGTIIHNINIPFAYPRKPSIRQDYSFVDLSNEISSKLNNNIKEL